MLYAEKTIIIHPQLKAKVSPIFHKLDEFLAACLFCRYLTATTIIIPIPICKSLAIIIPISITASQEIFKAKTQARNFEADFSDLTKPTWNHANEGITPNKNAESLKTLLLKNIKPKTLFWKVPPPKQEIYFYELKTATLKNDFNQKNKTCESKARLGFALGLPNY